MVTVESLKNKIMDKNNGNFDDLNDWERILKRRVDNRIRAMQNSHTLEQFEYGIDISLLDKQIDIIHKHFVILQWIELVRISHLFVKNFICNHTFLYT